MRDSVISDLTRLSADVCELFEDYEFVSRLFGHVHELIDEVRTGTASSVFPTVATRRTCAEVSQAWLLAYYSVVTIAWSRLMKRGVATAW